MKILSPQYITFWFSARNYIKVNKYSIARRMKNNLPKLSFINITFIIVNLRKGDLMWVDMLLTSVVIDGKILLYKRFEQVTTLMY